MEHFNFKGFTPSESLRIKAYRALDKIVDRAPSDANIVGVIEKDGDQFHCSIEVGSSSYPFSVSTTHRFVDIALDKMELTALRKLEHWCKSRFIKVEDAPFRAPFRMAT